MVIGIPKEIKTEEYRVAITPVGVSKLIRSGHVVLIETGAGKGSGFEDKDYKRCGAKILPSAQKTWEAQLILKVKEPQPKEYNLLRPGQVLFTYLHLAASPRLTQVLLKKNIAAIDYATVQTPDGLFPLLKPMSEISGKLSVQIGAHFLEKMQGGKGALLGGAAGVPPSRVLILGGGTVGTNAAKIALAMGARVILLEKSKNRMERLEKMFKRFGQALSILLFSQKNLEKFIAAADLLIGAALVPGEKTPKLVRKNQIKKMLKGSVLIDVSIDQGGCAETSRPTTHNAPVFVKYGVIHYCVTNIPSLVSETATIALGAATLPYVMDIANKGLANAFLDSPALKNGLNIYSGKVTHPGLARSLGLKYIAPERLL